MSTHCLELNNIHQLDISSIDTAEIDILIEKAENEIKQLDEEV